MITIQLMELEITEALRNCDFYYRNIETLYMFETSSVFLIGLIFLVKIIWENHLKKKRSRVMQPISEGNNVLGSGGSA